MDDVSEPCSPVNNECEIKQPATLEDIESLIARIDCNSMSELEMIKKFFCRMLNAPSWIAFYLISDAIKKIDRLLNKNTPYPEKIFEDIRSVISYLNTYYEIDCSRGKCFLKNENNQRNINSFKSLSSLYI